MSEGVVRASLTAVVVSRVLAHRITRGGARGPRDAGSSGPPKAALRDSLRGTGASRAGNR